MSQWVTQLKIAADDIRFKDVYNIGKRLGQGKFATVFQCQNYATKEMAAVKLIEKSQLSSTELQFLQEEI